VSILLNKTIRLFLDSIGRREEYEYYLERFRGDASNAFALLCPMDAGFDDAVSVLAFDLEFLLRLELDPVILLCGGDAERMQQKLLAGEHPFVVFPADLSNMHEGSLIAQMLDFLADCRHRSRVMVIVDPGATLNDALQKLIPVLSQRVHFIRMQGPLHDHSGNAINYLTLQGHEAADLEESDQPIVGIARTILALDPQTHISVASPLQLLQELFTVKGAGCVIRAGSVICHYTAIDQVEGDRLVKLLESSFGKTLVKRSCLERLSDLYIEEEYRGAALLEMHERAMYISKFAVDTAARGEGLAIELWQEMAREHKALYWRSKARNPINHWYEKRADGYHRLGEWKVFWRGVETESIPELIEDAVSREEDFSSLD
jgi:ribosomal protein S18 acetylase RimI-like enzyme